MPSKSLLSPACCVFASLLTFASAGDFDKDTVYLSHPHSGLANAALTRAAVDYHAATGQKVVILEEGWGPLPASLLNNETGADIVTVGSTWASDLYDKGRLTSLADRMVGWRKRRGRKGDVTRDFVRYIDYTYMFPGDRKKTGSLPEWHVLPLDVGTRVLYYRADLFREHLNLNRGPITLEEAQSFGVTIAKAERAKGKRMEGLVVPAGGGGSDVMQVMTTYAMGNGSAFVGPGETCTFESEGFLGALRTYAQEAQLDGAAAGGTMAIVGEFAAGRVAMFAGAAWIRALLDASSVEALSAGSVGYTPLPSGPTGPYVFQGGSGWAIPSWVPEAKRDAAWGFVEFFMEPSRPYLKELTFGSGLIPAYETLLRVEKLLSADLTQVNSVSFAGPGLDMSAAVFSNPDGIHSEAGFGVANLATHSAAGGTWRDAAVRPVVDVTFPAPVAVDTYRLSSSAEPTGQERDPVRWVLSAQLANGSFEVVHAQASTVAFPLARGAFTAALPVNRTARVFRLEFVQGRGSLCDQVCLLTVEQLSFAVPLHYPQQGFFKMGRLEANATVERMVNRVAAGMQDAATSARQACAELSIVLEDPPEPMGPSLGDHLGLVVGLSAGLGGLLVLLIGAAVIHNKVFAARTREEIDRLKNDNEMAEDLAAAVASMNLDSVEYLHSLEKPNRIQSAFKTITKNLAEFRAYMPASLLVDAAEDTIDTSDDEKTSDHATVTVRGPGLADDTRGSSRNSLRGSHGIPTSTCSAISVSSRGCTTLGTTTPRDRHQGIVTAVSLARRSYSCCTVNAVGFLKLIKGSSDEHIISVHTQLVEALLVVVATTRGVADIFTGDRMSITWGAVKQMGSHPMAACTAATLLRDLKNPIRLSAAVATGAGKVGNLGTNTMRRFTCLGSLPGWVQALERYNSACVSVAAVTDNATRRETLGLFLFRAVGMVSFEKRREGAPVSVYEVCAKNTGATEEEWMYQLEDTGSDPWSAWNRMTEALFDGRYSDADVLLSDAIQSGGDTLGKDKSRTALIEAVRRGSFVPTKIEYH